jgi:hypothetical protein
MLYYEVMKLYLLSALAALSLAPFAYAKSATISRTTQLQHIVAQEIPTQIKSASSLDQLTVNFQNNSVTASGSPEAVAAFEKELHAADVEPAEYRVVLRFVRYHVDEFGNSVETELSGPDITTTNTVQASMTVTTPGYGGYTWLFTPEKDGDGTVKLTVEVQETGEQGEIVSDGKNTQSVPLGKMVRITGMTDATDKPLRRAVQQGQIVLDHGEYTGYYVDVTPTIVSPHHNRPPSPQ